MNKPKLLSRKYFPRDLFCTVIFVVFSVSLFSSCTASKKSYYFKTLPKDTSINYAINKDAESKIRKGDLLAISISSLNPTEDGVYNAASGSGTNSGYLVDANGNIQMHRLGQIHAEGMTRWELKEKVQKDIQPYLKDPVVTVRYNNHRIIVLGEVGRPQILQMPEEHFSILEVIASSGDLSQTARKDNILVIRETPTGKQFKRINLEDHSIFTSEWFYLQPDDVVYVEPNDKKLKEERAGKKQQVINMALSGISLALIILDRVFR